VFAINTDTAAIPNDPMKPKVIAPTFDKQGVRFKYLDEPDDVEANNEGDVLVLQNKPLQKGKPVKKEPMLINMKKNPGRYDNDKAKSNIDLIDVAEDDGEFRGIDLQDMTKAFKANLPHEAVADFKNYRSIA
jgi:hypothetical protein